MDMDGTMGRRRTQRLVNDTWAGPWYEYEDEDGGRVRRCTQNLVNDTWAGPWYKYEYEDEYEDAHT